MRAAPDGPRARSPSPAGPPTRCTSLTVCAIQFSVDDVHAQPDRIRDIDVWEYVVLPELSGHGWVHLSVAARKQLGDQDRAWIDAMAVHTSYGVAWASCCASLTSPIRRPMTVCRLNRQPTRPTIRVMALSLSRTAGESIVLETRDGQRITVTLKRIEVTGEGARTVRLDVDAPRDVTILRGELQD